MKKLRATFCLPLSFYANISLKINFINILLIELIPSMLILHQFAIFGRSKHQLPLNIINLNP